jgi:hypothetical protein
MQTKLNRMVFTDVKRPPMHKRASAMQWCKLQSVCMVLQLEGALDTEAWHGFNAIQLVKAEQETH